jgi:hypothetical protein
MNINKFYINCNTNKTELCEIGAKYGTDKSPYNDLTSEYYRHSYTPFYSLLFSNIRNDQINLGEVGILYNSSIKMWREYFSNANIYAWDGNHDHLENAKSHNLHNVFYDYMHTSYEESIQQSFNKTQIKFNILIDDASHFFWDQIRLIRGCVDYLLPNSTLIIEDIDKNNSDESYISEIKNYGHDKYYDSISFIEFDHTNKNLIDYNNDKIIVLTRSNYSI